MTRDPRLLCRRTAENIDMIERLIAQEAERVEAFYRDAKRCADESPCGNPIQEGKKELLDGLQHFLVGIEKARRENRLRLTWKDARMLLRAEALYGQRLSQEMRNILRTIKDDKDGPAGPIPRTQEFYFQT